MASIRFQFQLRTYALMLCDKKKSWMSSLSFIVIIELEPAAEMKSKWTFFVQKVIEQDFCPCSTW